MLTRTTAKNQVTTTEDFDPITFELQREEIFNRTERVIPSPKYSRYSADQTDGEWDAKVLSQPNLSRWGCLEYRRGYLAGIEEKYIDQFAQLA